MRVPRRSIFAIASLVCLTLAQAATKPEEVIVSSTALHEHAEDVVQPIQVMSGDELTRQISSSIGETIAKQPGITGTYFGPNASRPVIRGLGGERVQVLEDNIGALDVSSLSEDHAVSIEDAVAKQVEIVKGPATLLYGSGAVGGIVNIITNRIPSALPENGLAGAFEARGDTALEERTGVGRLDAGAGSFALHLDAFKRRTDDVNIPGYAFSRRARATLLEDDPDAPLPKGKIPNSDSESDGGALGASWIGSRGFAGVSVSRFNTNYGVPQPPGEADTDGGPRIDMHQNRYDFKAEFDGEGDGWFRELHLRASHNDYEHKELEADGSIGTKFTQKGTAARLAVEHSIGALSGSAGLQYSYADFAAIGDEQFVPPSITRNTGVFLFEKYPLGEVTLEGGARVEKQSIDPQSSTGLPAYDNTSLSGSFGALWKFQPQLALALNVTHSQRHPTATELYADGPHDATSQFIVGNPQIHKETANTLDLGLRGTGTVRWQLSTYMNDFSDYVFLAPTADVADGLPVFDYRQADARFMGAEAEVTFPLLKSTVGILELRLASDYIRAQLKNGGGDLPQIPPLRFGGDLTWTSDRWQAEFSTFRYNDQNDVASYEPPTDGYTMVDASVSYKIPTQLGSVLVFTKGTNLTDEEARRHTSPLKEYAPLPGRSLLAGVRVEF